MHKNLFYKVFVILAVAAAYMAAARLGLLLALPPGYASPFWPPSGIATAAILMLGSWIWPGILIGSFVANLLTTAGQFSVSLFVSSGIAIGSTLQALVVGTLIKQYANGTNYFESHKNVFKFILATFAGCTIAATTGLLFLALGNVITIRAIGTNWMTWWLGDSAGIFVFTSFLVTVVKTFDPEELMHQALEAIQILVYIACIAILCFWDWFGHGYPIEYMFIPFLIWAIFRFEPYFCIGLLIMISSIAMWGTANGFGPFAHGSTNESLLLLQAFVGVFAMGSLFMMSILNELDFAFHQMEEYTHLLQEQVKNTEIPKEMAQVTEKGFASITKQAIANGNKKHHALVDFNGLVIGFTNLAYLNRQSKESGFKLNLNKHLDPGIGLVEIATVDFSRALILLLENAFDSVIQKEHESVEEFTPEITVDTHDLGSKVSITIRDNGNSIVQEENKIRLTECYDLIVRKLKGELKFQHNEDSSFYEIIFPKVAVSS